MYIEHHSVHEKELEKEKRKKEGTHKHATIPHTHKSLSMFTNSLQRPTTTRKYKIACSSLNGLENVCMYMCVPPDEVPVTRQQFSLTPCFVVFFLILILWPAQTQLYTQTLTDSRKIVKWRGGAEHLFEFCYLSDLKEGLLKVCIVCVCIYARTYLFSVSTYMYVLSLLVYVCSKYICIGYACNYYSHLVL